MVQNGLALHLKEGFTLLDSGAEYHPTTETVHVDIEEQIQQASIPDLHEIKADKEVLVYGEDGLSEERAHESRLEIVSSPVTTPLASSLDTYSKEPSLTFAGRAPPLLVQELEMKTSQEHTEKRILSVALLIMSMVCGGLMASLVLRYESAHDAVQGTITNARDVTNVTIITNVTHIMTTEPPTPSPSSVFILQGDSNDDEQTGSNDGDIPVIASVRFNVSDDFYTSSTTPSNTMVESDVPSDAPSSVESFVPSVDDSAFPSMAPTAARSGFNDVETLEEKCARVYPTQPPLPGKKGAAMRFGEAGLPGSWEVNLPKVLSLKPHWNYNWGAKRIDAQPDDVEFVPMIWGGYTMEKVQASLDEHVFPLIKSGVVKRLFGFNEPDLESQSNMKVEKALSFWSAFEATGLPLTSPSCAHPDREWMQAFMADVKATCKRVDWVGAHWYKSPDFDSFKSDITQYYEMNGRRPVILTEFAVADWKATTVDNNRYSSSTVLAFMKKAVPWLEAQDWIVGYAWFNFAQIKPEGTSSALFRTDGSLTILGQYYASVRSNKPRGNQTIGSSSSN